MGKKDKIVIVGGGGHAKVLIELIRRSGIYTIAGILDPGLRAGVHVLDVPVLGGDRLLPDMRRKGIRNICLGVGRVGMDDRRKRLFEKVRKLGFDVPSQVHPAVVIADSVRIGEGAQIMAGAVIQPGCEIGENTIVNTAVTVDHDCSVAGHVHLCPGTVVSGGCTIGENSFIGAGTVIIHGITIGKNVLVGAGSVVIRDVPDGRTVKGVPAR